MNIKDFTKDQLSLVVDRHGILSSTNYVIVLDCFKNGKSESDKREIAEICGATVATVSRIINDLQDRKVLQYRNDELQLTKLGETCHYNVRSTLSRLPH
jgi:DNA-binding IclR family transcriptional regulator